MSVALTVRAQILAAIADALGDLPHFGAVLMPGAVSAEELQNAEGKLAANEYVAEVTAGMDERAAEGSKPNAIEALSFEVMVRIRIPQAPLAADGTPATISEELASELHALVYGIYTTGAAARGRWLNGSGVALSIDTTLIAGGGLFVDTEQGQIFTPSAFSVSYRHTYGKPGEAR